MKPSHQGSAAPLDPRQATAPSHRAATPESGIRDATPTSLQTLWDRLARPFALAYIIVVFQ